MKIQRKLAGFSACALVLSSLTVPVAHAAEVDFKDIDSHWAKSSIERWAGYEVVNGMGNNQFKPEDTMTRAQMAQILSKTLGLTATTTTNPFSDVKDTDWFKDAILKCNAAGIMNGTSATTAKPDAPISRQDAVTMMSRALGIEADGDSTSFDDNGSIGSWAVGFVNAMAKRGIVNGRSEGMFAPTGDIKRGEIATILDRAITTYVNTPDTEVTASAKGITLIAASGVTVKGEAEDILVAPAAAGTTKLDGVKVSGAVTMQAANGTLVLGGATTAAKLNIPALATGAKITIEKDATVAAVSSSADNVAIDGNGTITAMTVETGKGVTVAGSVKVGKITNNSQDSMKHGNNVIAGVGGSKPSTGGGGSSSGGGGGGSQTTTVTAETSKEFVEAARAATGSTVVTMTGDKFDDEVFIFNDEATDLTLDLSGVTAKKFIFRSESENRQNITITGTNSENQIETLIIEAPNADVTSEITVNDAQIEAVKDESYHPNKKHKTIQLKGKGKLEVPSKAKNPEVVVLSKNENDKITISGDVKNVTVKSPAQIILDAISNVLNLTSQNKNANITVQNTVTTSTADGDTPSVTVSGEIATLTASDNVTLGKDATVTTANVADGKTVTGNEGATISTVKAEGNVTLTGSMTVSTVTTTEKTETVKLDGTTVTVTSITTSTTLTIAGSGTVKSVDVVDAEGDVSIKTEGDAKIEQVAAVGKTDVNKIDTTATKKEKLAPPAEKDVKGDRDHDTWGVRGFISGVDATMQIAKVKDGKVSEADYITAENITDSKMLIDAGTYAVRYAAKTENGVDKLASEPIFVVVPAQVGVKTATITGNPWVGRTLKAVANIEETDAADAPLQYLWKVNGEAQTTEPTDNDSFEVKETGKAVTVVISNYGGATSAESPAVYTDEEGSVATVLAKLNADIASAQANLDKAKVSADGSDILTTDQYITKAAKTAYQNAINAAKEFSSSTSRDDIRKAIADLEAATKAFNEAKQDGKKAPTDEPPKSETYTITTDTVANVTLTVDKTSAAQGDTVTITATPADGYTVTAVTAKDASDADVTVNKSETEENTWTFTMPASNVTVTATATQATPGTITVEDTTKDFTYAIDGDTTNTYKLANDVSITDIVTVDSTTAEANQDVTITLNIAKLKKDEGTYTLKADTTPITLTDESGNSLSDITITKGAEDNTWTFKMPDPAVNIKIKVSNLTLTWDRTNT